MTTKKFYGWQVGAALWVSVFVNMGFTNYGGSAISALMAQDMNFDRSVLGLAFTILLFTQGLTAPVVAWGANRIGIRLTMSFGSLVVAFGAAILAHLVNQPWQYILAYGVVVGLGSGLSSHVPAQACITLWFVRNRSVALSIVLAAIGVGGFAAAPLLSSIIEATGGDWRKGWDFIVALALMASLISFVYIKNRPAEYGQLPDGGPAPSDAIARTKKGISFAQVHRTSHNWPVRDALKTRVLWLITLGSISYLISLSVFVAHAIPHLRDLGNSVTMATMGLSTMALCSIVGKLGAGFLCDSFEPRFISFFSLVLTAAGAVLSIGATGSAEIYFFGACLGLGFGGAMVCGSTLIANYFGGGSFASIMGALMPINTTIASLSPFIVGMVHDKYGTYTSSFITIGSLSLISGTLVLLLALPPTRRSMTN